MNHYSNNTPPSTHPTLTSQSDQLTPIKSSALNDRPNPQDDMQSSHDEKIASKIDGGATQNADQPSSSQLSFKNT